MGLATENEPKSARRLVLHLWLMYNEVGALDTIHLPEIVPPLAALLQSPSYVARMYAEERLAVHPGRATVDAILPMLNDSKVYVRDWAIRALGANMDDRIPEMRRLPPFVYRRWRNWALIYLTK